ncbi:MAG: Ig-like domain-containing protein, partial [Bacteroidales bacterium]|nr:Ig-like domain-containing protein [Bacteroidales bacterium]
MRLKHILPFLALAAGLLSGCDPEKINEQLKGTEDKLTVSPASQKIAQDGTASFTFTFSLLRSDGTAIDLTKDKTTATVHFEATGGTVSPASATTDERGNVSVTFTASDPKSFTGGTVNGTVKNVKGIVEQQGNLATATAQVLPLDAEDPPVVDEPIKKAEVLRENTYSIQKKGEEARVFTFPPEYSSWYTGTSYMDGSKQAIHVELMDEDPEQMTMGWMSAEFPPEVADKLTTVNEEFYGKYSWSSAKLGTMRVGQNKMLDCHMGKGGNVKLDGSSQFWLKEKGGTKAYSGDYQLLFVFVFENQEYDPETDTYVPSGEEYTICGNATVKELVAELSDFHLDYEDYWVAPGKSTTISAHWTAGASFDWSKVKLNSQTCNGQSGEWFSWDASTQKLTATQSAENQQVDLTFGYSGTEMTYKISLYNGPGYSSF